MPRVDRRMGIAGATLVIVALVAVALLVFLGGDGGDTPDGGVDRIAGATAQPGSAAGAGGAGDLAAIEVSPSTVLLTGAGETMRVEATLSGDAAGAAVSWHSNDPDTIAIDDDGTIEARVDVGSALITATAGGAQSPPVLVYVAQPVDGAILVGDDQVQGDPRDVPYPLPTGVHRYIVRLTGIATPSLGDVIIGTGEAPVGGVVVEATEDGGAVEVTLQVMRPEEMFDRIEIDEEIALDYAEATVAEPVADEYDVQRLPDGTFEFTPRPSAALGPARHHPISQNPTTYYLGPFECETSFPSFPLSLSQPAAFSLKPNLSISILVRDRFERLVLSGQPTATLTVSPTLNAMLTGKVGCKLEVVELTIPAGGPLAYLFGGHVPLGLGMELEGKLTLARLGFKAQSQVGADFRLGVECPGETGCSMVNELDFNADGSVEWLIPDPEEQFRIEPTLFAFAYAELEVGAKFSERFRFDALEMKAGMSQAANLAPVSVQAGDRAYASDYQLSLKGEAEAGQELDRWLALLNLSALKLKVEVDEVIHRSPLGAASADVAEFAAGDPVTFEVGLDESHLFYPIVGYNIDEVRVYRRSGGEMVAVATQRPAEGDDRVTLQWTADHDGSIDGQFFAFAVTNALSIPPLELGPVAPGTGGGRPGAGAAPPPTRSPLGDCRVRVSRGEGLGTFVTFEEGTTIRATLTSTGSDGVTPWYRNSAEAVFVWPEGPLGPHVWEWEMTQEWFSPERTETRSGVTTTSDVMTIPVVRDYLGAHLSANDLEWPPDGGPVEYTISGQRIRAEYSGCPVWSN